MATTLKEKLDQLPPKRRAKIEAETDRLYAEYQTLKELRKARELTQVKLAEALNVRQATVAKMERRSDLMISTLRGYVEGMGGKLSLVVEFPGKKPVALRGLAEADEEPVAYDATRPPGRRKSARSRVREHK